MILDKIIGRLERTQEMLVNPLSTSSIGHEISCRSSLAKKYLTATEEEEDIAQLNQKDKHNPTAQSHEK